MFLGRASELNYLNTYYEREGSQLMVVYGAKNIGKTTLLRQFVQDKTSYYYCARSAGEREQRYEWGRELGNEGIRVAKYPSFYEIFDAIPAPEGGKLVFVIDEFQNIVRTDHSFMTELLQYVHSRKAESPVMVILCSSSIGWVENSMVTRIGEAAYELTGFLKIRELPFEQLREFFPNFSMEQCIESYAVLGGVPGLWVHFDDKRSIRENICETILERNRLLCGEGQRIVGEELRETGVYNTILASIAAGNHKLNDLYLHTGFSRAKISVYLKNLMELELVEKIFSYDTEGKANTQKGIYRITNHFVHFYFRFLYPNISRLELLTPENFYQSLIAPSFKTYVAEYFRGVCRQHMEKMSRQNRLPVTIDRIGEWVGKLSSIDIIAQNEQGKTIVGGCCFDKPMMRYEDYEWLLFGVDKAKLRADYIYLFSVHGFDERLTLEAKVKQNLNLISLEDM